MAEHTIHTLDLAARGRTRKAPNAFRTISEVADDLHIPQHVLRFWETKFNQIRPLKRGGGRRYYRPDDIILLKRIADLLYTQGYTIKGVQRLLRESGGQLSDEAPPPSEEDRAHEEADSLKHHGQALLLPQLDLIGPPRLPPRRSPHLRSNSEADRLRNVLEEMLQELQHLRSLLKT